jgi:predicted deacylase
VPGPKFLVTGAVHGNEKCGSYAIKRVLKEIEDGVLTVDRGSVTFVPICNPKAFVADTRFVERNLNRFLIPMEKPDCYEANLGNILCPILANCNFLLDLHSYSVGSDPFVFVGPPNDKEYAFAQSLCAAALLTGWQSAYAASGREDKKNDPEESTGTTEYSRKFGAIAVTLECGQHKAAESAEFAYQAIHRALRYLQITLQPLQEKQQKKHSHLIEVKKVFYRGNGGAFVKDWKHLDPVKKEETIAIDENKKPIKIPDDGYLILPHFDAPNGTEWFYWGIDISSPS